MIGGDDYSTAVRHVLNAVELNLPEQATEEGNNGPEYFERPLRKYCAAALRSRFQFLSRIFAVTTAQVPPILQRPFLIYELDVNSGNAVCPCAARSNRRMRHDALLVARQADKPASRNL